ncbi:unnamed protein product [Blumeria hordei]|uniref:Uncharacterized protein n=1 Tax=Blumeria hordei TaxID=2867405 RepID=A0A383USP1_BLUHO|nr:unnamed protein product [Blumeria hordei]
MAAVQQQVLNWLYSVLTSEYKDVNRTYKDVAQTLSYYYSLSPKTDVYTYENGSAALLLHIFGTLPVVFREITYRFPIELWIPHSYPKDAPIVYVTSAENLMIRPGQHVDLQGKIYHPYLVRWAENWDKCNILEFLEILRNIFAKEPPVVLRPPITKSLHSPPVSSSSAPVSTKILSQTPQLSDQEVPPPPPPKPKASNTDQPNSLFGSLARSSTGPPLPPLPGTTERSDGSSVNHRTELSRDKEYHLPFRENSLHHEPPARPPPPPRSSYPIRSPASSEQTCQKISSIPAKINEFRPDRKPDLLKPSLSNSRHNNEPHQYIQQQCVYTKQSNSQSPQPPLDLLSTPLDPANPQASNVDLPAPPVPHNPEKDLLIQKIGHALYSQRQQQRAQTTSTLARIEAQHNSMLSRLAEIESEMQKLGSLNDLLETNTKILHGALYDAEIVIKSSKHRTLPSIDELLVAPTVVANQLYNLVSDERSLGDALFVLGRAMERGRISAAVFAKMTRALAREWYLKKALVRKIGHCMGLTSY